MGHRTDQNYTTSLFSSCLAIIDINGVLSLYNLSTVSQCVAFNTHCVYQYMQSEVILLFFRSHNCSPRKTKVWIMLEPGEEGSLGSQMGGGQ